MRKIWLLIPLFSIMKIHSAIPTPHEVRKLFQLAASDKASCEKLITILQPYDEKNNSVLAGYKACATMLMARHVFNPYSKLSYFSNGKLLLEKCIAANASNPELRFLRFTTQTNSPSFLGYNSSLKSDKAFLLQTFPTLKDVQLKQLLKSFLMGCNLLTEAEKQNLQS